MTAIYSTFTDFSQLFLAGWLLEKSPPHTYLFLFPDRGPVHLHTLLSAARGTFRAGSCGVILSPHHQRIWPRSFYSLWLQEAVLSLGAMVKTTKDLLLSRRREIKVSSHNYLYSTTTTTKLRKMYAVLSLIFFLRLFKWIQEQWFFKIFIVYRSHVKGRPRWSKQILACLIILFLWPLCHSLCSTEALSCKCAGFWNLLLLRNPIQSDSCFYFLLYLESIS